MRAFLLSAAAALCMVGCSQQSIPPPAHIVGTNSMVVVNDLLFVTSPGAAELRVLDLRISPRDFVRAPNPLEPLSIPVLNAPAMLARDIDYTPAGDIDDTTYNPYVYVQGAASAEISIVGSRRDNQLVELKRLVAPGVVTAIAARAPEGGDPNKDSTLYFATLSAGQGSLWTLTIPHPDPTTGRMTADPDSLPRTRLEYVPGGVGDPISSILVLPNHRIAVASRAVGSTVGRSIILDTTTQKQWVLQFPSPVRQLVTHPAVRGLIAQLPVAARIFGVLDEDACGTSTDCPGILAVDALESSPTFTMRSVDASGSPMVPIRDGSGLISGLSLGLEVPLAFPGGGVQTIDLLGIVTTTSGLIYFFDGFELNVLDTGVTGLDPVAQTLSYVIPSPSQTIDGRDAGYVPGPIPGTVTNATIPYPDIKVALGAALDETVTVVYQGTIPSFRGVPITGTGVVTQLPIGAGDPTRLVAGADRVVVTATGSDQTVCTEVALTGIDLRNGLLLTEPISCAGSNTFSVRAGGNQPYVVEGSTTGYMGRTGNNQTFAFPANVADRYSRYYFHPPPELGSFDPRNPQPQIQFSMGPGYSPPQRDAAYAITVVSNYVPEYILVDISIGIEFHTPGASAFVGLLPDNTDVTRLYVAYPSGNAVLEFSPQLLIPNAPNARYVAAFR